MKKILLFLLISCLFISCRTVTKVETKYVTKDSLVTKEVVKYRDTTINYVVPPRQDSIQSIGQIVNKKLNILPIHVQNDFSLSTAWVEENRLHLLLSQKDTTLKFRLTNALKEATYWKELYQKKISTATKTEVEYKTPVYAKVIIGVLSVLLIISLLVIGLMKFTKTLL